MDYMDFVRPLSTILFFFVSRNICDLKIPKLKFILWIAVSYVLVAVAVYFSEPAGSVILLTLIFIMNYRSGSKIMSSLMCSMYSMIILVICNSVSGLILENIYVNVNYRAVVSDHLGIYMLLLALNYIFSQLLSKLTGLILHKKLGVRNVKGIRLSINVMFLTVTVLVFFFIYFTALFNQPAENPLIIILYIGFFVILGMLTYFIFNSTLKENKLKTSEEELKQLEAYTENIESMYNDIKSIRHDYANVIYSMIGYMDDNDMEALRKYFDEEIIPFFNRMEKSDNNLAALANLKEPSLKGVVAVKLIRAQDNNIQTIVDIKDDIHIKSIDLLDLNRIVGILLDNAFEAAVESKKPFIDVGFIKDKSTVTIAVANSIENDNINISKIFNKGYSTKGENRGYGLSNITGILEKNPNVVMDTVVEDKKFIQVIHIEEEG